MIDAEFIPDWQYKTDNFKHDNFEQINFGLDFSIALEKRVLFICASQEKNEIPSLATKTIFSH